MQVQYTPANTPTNTPTAPLNLAHMQVWDGIHVALYSMPGMHLWVLDHVKSKNNKYTYKYTRKYKRGRPPPGGGEGGASSNTVKVHH